MQGRDIPSMAILTATAVEDNGTVADSAVPRSVGRLAVMVAGIAGVGGVTIGADDGADFGTLMAEGAEAKRVAICGMVAGGRAGRSDAAVMTTGAVETRGADPDMTDAAISD